MESFILENEPFMSDRRFKKGGQVAKSLFLAKSVQIEGKKCFFCLIFSGNRNSVSIAHVTAESRLPEIHVVDGVSKVWV